MKPSAAKKYSAPSKRRRLPNGFGQISEIKGKNLRNPYRAMVTVGKTPEGKPICKPLRPQAYFRTYNDAYAALVEYHKNPYDMDDDITLKELYAKWHDEKLTNQSESYRKSMESIWMYCIPMENMRMKEIRIHNMKQCINDACRVDRTGTKIYASATTKIKIKTLFNILFDYAVEYEVVETNYARMFSLEEKSKTEKHHSPFTEDELDLMWANVENIKFLDWILIQCYMGWRPMELVELTLDHVNINEWYAIGGSKTDAGKNRMVPIHSKIRPLVKYNYEAAIALKSNFLFTNGPSKANGLKYTQYLHRFNKVMAALGIDGHTPHDARTTFITMAKKYKVDEYAIKVMVGHTIVDLTESTYTKRDIEWLRTDIEKIK